MITRILSQLLVNLRNECYCSMTGPTCNLCTSGLEWFVYSFSDICECDILPIKCFLVICCTDCPFGSGSVSTAKDRLIKYVGIYIPGQISYIDLLANEYILTLQLTRYLKRLVRVV